MDIKIIRKEEQNTAEWSGGTTTQLYIFPEDSSYKDKTFSFRLSSAKVDVDESIFTKLEGVARDIMVLDGEMELAHEGRYSKTLKQFDTDQFQGDWNTKSKGKVTDFNLMTTGKNNGYISHMHLSKDEAREILIPEQYNVAALYTYKGEVSVSDLTKNKEEHALKENDFAVIFVNNEQKTINIRAGKSSDIIISKIEI